MILRGLLGVGLLIAIPVGLLALPDRTAQACSCDDLRPSAIATFDQVFVGRVLGQRPLPDPEHYWAQERWAWTPEPGALFQVGFAVERAWRGQAPPRLWVVDIDGDCTATYERGRRYLVAAEGPTHLGLTGACTVFRADGDYAQAVIRGLVRGLGWGITPPPPHWLADCAATCRDDLLHRTVAPPPLTAVDADCLRYRQLTGVEAWRTATLVRLNYTPWQAEALPACERIADFGRSICASGDRLGLRYGTRAELEALLEALGITWVRPYREFRAATTVWC